MSEKAEKNAVEKIEADMNNSIHFVLQGKGGMGKSLISAWLAQYFKSKLGTLYMILCNCHFSVVTVQAITKLDNKAAHRHAPVL